MYGTFADNVVSLFSLMDLPDAHKNALKRLIRNSKRALFEEVGIACDDSGQNNMDYYTTIDMENLVEQLFGRDFVDWLPKEVNPNELLFRLASDARAVLLSGFGTPHPSGCVSLVNLDESDCREIGRTLRKLIGEWVQNYNEATGKKLDPAAVKR